MKFYRRDGSEVEAEEGSRIEWDSITGFGIPGTGMIVGFLQSSNDRFFPPPAYLWIDPNEGLKQLTEQIRNTEDPLLKSAARDVIYTGLNGQGGFLCITGESLQRGILGGKIRILPERWNPEPYRAKLRTQRMERPQHGPDHLYRSVPASATWPGIIESNYRLPKEPDEEVQET